jgi:hypothetical protein
MACSDTLKEVQIIPAKDTALEEFEKGMVKSIKQYNAGLVNTFDMWTTFGLTCITSSSFPFLRLIISETLEVMILNLEPIAQEIRERYMRELEDMDVRELAIHRRLDKVNYSRRCAEASAVQAYQKR